MWSDLGILAWFTVLHTAGTVAVGEDGDCIEVHPPRHRMVVVRDNYKDREDVGSVESDLRERAREALQKSVCANRSATQCDAILQQVGIDVAHSPARRVMCAAAMVESNIVDDPDGLEAQVERIRMATGRLASELSEKDEDVASIAVRWLGGCEAGIAGSHLAAALRSGLTERGIAITEGDGVMIEARLVPGEPTVMELWRYQADGRKVMMTSEQLTANWLGLHGSGAIHCADGQALSTDGGGRRDGDGLKIALNVTADGALCPGELVTADVLVSKPTEVQLWNVGRGGDAWLIYTSRDRVGPPLVHTRTKLVATPDPTQGREQLVAVAAPPGVALPAGKPGCLLPALSQMLPDGVAVATSYFTVAPTGSEGCTAIQGDADSSRPRDEPAPLCQ